MDDPTKDDLLDEARRLGIPGRSSMTKSELEAAVEETKASNGQPGSATPGGADGWIRDHLLSLTLLGMFLLSWLGQLYFQYRQEIHEALQHSESPPAFFSSDFWVTFLSSTLENWQSEFLQLATMVLLTTYLIHRNSPQSRDSSDEMAADIKAIKAKLDA